MSSHMIDASSHQSMSKNTSVKDYFLLLKPRVMSLVVFTGVVGIYMAPGAVHPFIAALATFLIALGSGAAGAVNMWYERDIDAKMKRTMNRPVAAGRIPPENALEFAIVCAATSVFLMLLTVGYMAAILLLGAILFYVFIYTIWLKQRTPLNIVIGGAAGALPPMIGWAVVTNSISAESILLFSIIFMWTPPHFWALALVKSDDYQKAGIPMLPNVSGQQETLKQILVYTILLLPITIAPYFIGISGTIYLVGASILGAGFLFHAVRLFFGFSESRSMRMFAYSIFYLFGIFSLLMLDKFL